MVCQAEGMLVAVKALSPLTSAISGRSDREYHPIWELDADSLYKPVWDCSDRGEIIQHLLIIGHTVMELRSQVT